MDYWPEEKKEAKKKKTEKKMTGSTPLIFTAQKGTALVNIFSFKKRGHRNSEGGL